MSRRPPSAPPTRSFARLRAAVLPIARRYGARNVCVFGSVARGEEHRTSDVDLLVTMPAGSSLLDLAGLRADLEAALRRKVDVLPDDSIKPALRASILADARPL